MFHRKQKQTPKYQCVTRGERRDEKGKESKKMEEKRERGKRREKEKRNGERRKKMDEKG